MVPWGGLCQRFDCICIFIRSLHARPRFILDCGIVYGDGVVNGDILAMGQVYMPDQLTWLGMFVIFNKLL